MASAREIKKRIRSVQNIGQITRALEAVSASRVRRAQARVLASRAYAEKAWEILTNVQSASQNGVPVHELLTARTGAKKVLVVLITSERGLAGAYNSNMVRVAQMFERRMQMPVEFITLGRKGRDTIIRQGANVIADFPISSEPTIADISPATKLAMDMFLSGEVDDVYIAYTDYVNVVTQRPVVLGWLPLTPRAIDRAVLDEQYVKQAPQVTTGRLDYEYEPSPTAILDEIVPAFTELILYQAVLEAQASEHSARMVAMRNASDNAKSFAADLTLVYNKARQAGITSEILDIVGGAEALQESIDKAADEILMRFQNETAAASTKAKQSGGAEITAPAPVALAEPPASAVSLPQYKGQDDLTVIEGIGPKMAAALRAAGIDTFGKLAEADEASLRAAIEAAKMSFAPSLPSWPEQAAYVLRGDMDGLKAFQKQLTAGRKD